MKQSTAIQTFHEQSVGAFEAKTNLSRYLEDAARGTVTIVTKHGKPIAKIVPADAEVRTSSPFDFAAWMERTRAIREQAKAGPESLHDLINEGRR